MESISPGDLVKVAGDGPALDGIVFDTPSRAKVVVAVVTRGRGPGFRTVHPDVLSEREEEAPGDKALRLLIRRTPSTARGGARGRAGAATGSSAGHSRGAAHRPTGK